MRYKATGNPDIDVVTLFSFLMTNENGRERKKAAAEYIDMYSSYGNYQNVMGDLKRQVDKFKNILDDAMDY